ncbi:hypothetical protein [Citreimonas sp.]|uniref:hypothetical protein n=1 Tax=Citreimonas sp. TaxID=3036715 RepID=UPI004058FACE
MLDDTHPSGRPATRIDATTRAALIVHRSGPAPRAVSQHAWLQAKEAQRLEDDTSARIDCARLSILEDRPSHWPGAHLRVIAEAPMVSGHELSEVEAATQAALPATRAAIARHRGMGPTGGDAA